MTGIQEVTKRQIIDYGAYFEYVKYSKGWSRSSHLKAQETRNGLKLSGLMPTIKEQIESIEYIKACEIFGEEIVSLPESEKRYRQSIQRSQRVFKEILKANLYEGHTSFVSLTYKKNITNRKTVLLDLLNFKRKLIRKGFKIEYLGVMEQQKRGAWHFHLILFNHDIKLKHKILQNAWGNTLEYGVNAKYIKEKTHEDIEKMSSYLTKYLGKETVKSNKKAYFTTKGINRPKRMNDSSEVSTIMETYKDVKPFEVYDKPNTHLGHTYFSKYHKIMQE